MTRLFISEEAERLLQVLTPQPTPISIDHVHTLAVLELTSAGLAVITSYGSGPCIALTEKGRRHRPSVNN